MLPRSLSSWIRVTLASSGGAIVYGATAMLLDVAIAHRYGTGTQAAVYQAAYLVPTALIGVFSSAAILGAFIPIFIRLGGGRQSAEARAFLWTGMWLVTALLTLIVGLLVAIAPAVAGLVASGFESQWREEVAVVIRLVVPMVIFHGIANVFGAALMARGYGGTVILAPVIIPLTGLATSPWWQDTGGAQVIAVASFTGSVLFAAALALRLQLAGFRLSPVRSAPSPAWREFAYAYAGAALAHAAMAALFLVAQSNAGGISATALVAFSYGTRLILLAMAFATTIITSLVLPHFSTVTGQLGREEVWRLAWPLLLAAFVASGIAALVWAVFADQIVSLTYVRGQFTSADAVLVADVQRMFVLQVPFYVVGVICWRTLNALGQWRPLAWSSVVALGLGILLILRLAQTHGVAGIATAHSLAIACWAIALLISLRSIMLAQQRPQVREGS